MPRSVVPQHRILPTMGNNEFHDYIDMSIPVQINLTPVDIFMTWWKYVYPYGPLWEYSHCGGNNKIMMAYVGHRTTQFLNLGIIL